MKVKEVLRTANVSWSPAAQYPIYLAAGTAAQQLDATFSTNASLEIFALDLVSHKLEMPLKGSLSSEHRFHQIIWADHGIGTEQLPCGTLIGGTDKGEVILWNPDKIMNGDPDEALLHLFDEHVGPVQALDVNPIQKSFLASGGAESEIFIWDLDQPQKPSSKPGPKELPNDNVSCVRWNRQVSHILGSTSPGGRCSVWDLRKNEAIIKVGDQSAMIRCKAIEWHPEVATQLVLASEDDRCPVIQLWDLRFAASPVRTFERHQRGILSIAWCPQDPDLLMSCGKDNRILCWNPNSQEPKGEVVYELPTAAQWSFDVKWCPRNPAMICTSSFDGHVSVHSLMGGSVEEQQQCDQQKINDIFGTGTDDVFGMVQQMQQQQQKAPAAAAAPLKKPPKWLRRPCGASFAFGGKVISFSDSKTPGPRTVQISQVITEPELVNRSNELEGALVSGSYTEYCDAKIARSSSELDRTLWQFLKVTFEKEPRPHFLSLLGHDAMDVSKKVSALGSADSSSHAGGVDASELAQKMQLLSSVDGEQNEDILSSGPTTPSVSGSKTPLSDTEGAAVFDAIAAGGPLTIDSSTSVSAKSTASLFAVAMDDDTDGLISQALLTGNFDAAVDVCLRTDRMADALLLAISGGPELLARTQRKYFENNKGPVSRLISVIVNRDWRDIVENCVIDNWREALAAMVTYASVQEFSELCNLLGKRLEQEGENYCTHALVCYIIAGNVDSFVSCWRKTMPSDTSALDLQDLIEKVMILKKAVLKEKRDMSDFHSQLVDRLSKYAELLAAQGRLETAMGYLMSCNDSADTVILKDRLYHAQSPSQLTASVAPPGCPFQKIDVRATPAPQPTQAQPTQSMPQYQQPPKVPTPTPMQPPSMPQPGQMYNPALYQQPHKPTPIQPPMPTMQPTPQPHPPPPNTLNPSWQQPQYPMPGQQPSPTMPYQPPVQNITPPITPNQGPVSLYNPAAYKPTSNFPPAPPQAPQQPAVPPPSNMAPPPVGPPPTGGYSGGHSVMKKTPSPYTPPAPITTPIYNPVQPSQGDMQPQGPPSHGGPIPPGGPPAFHPPAPQKVPLLPPPTTSFIESDTPSPPPPTSSSPPLDQQEPPKEVIKPPIPAEYLELQETFDALVLRCKSSATNVMTKKKLDDVSKRLEAMYDRLRDNTLTSKVLEGLLGIAQACRAADYSSGLAYHTSLISSGSFADISAFMPGLKSLMQIATQLRV